MAAKGQPYPGRPSTICFPDLHPKLVQFLQLRNIYAKYLENRLRNQHAQLEFPKDNGGVLKAICSLTRDDLAKYRKLEQNERSVVERIFAEWEPNVRQTLSELTNDLIVDESIHCPVEIWTQMVQELSKNPAISLQATQKYALLIDPDSYRYTVVGERSAALNYVAVLQSLVDDLKEKTYDRNDPVTKKLSLKPFQMKVLQRNNTITRIRSQFRDVNISEDNNFGVLVISGREPRVDMILKDIGTIFSEQVRKCIPCAKITASLVQKSKVQDFINQHLQEAVNTSVWYVTSDNDIVVMGRYLEKVKECVAIITRNVKNKKIKLVGEQSDLFHTEEGSKELDRICHNWSGYVEIWEDSGCIQYAATKTAFREVEMALRALIEERGIFAEYEELHFGIVVFMQVNMAEDYSALERRCVAEAVSIQTIKKANRSRCCLTVTGVARQRKAIIAEFKTLVAQVKIGKHTMRGLGLDILFLTEEVVSEVDAIEKKYRCILEYPGRNLERKLTTLVRLSTSSSSETASSNASDNQTTSVMIRIVQGELAEQEVDVICNPTNQNLDLRRGQESTRLLEAGGAGIQEECEAKYPEGIQISQLAVTSSGSLKCRLLYHGVLIRWDGGLETSEHVMKLFLLKCLQQADDDGMKSIAFPALGVEELDYPADFVAWLMFDCVETFRSENPESSLEEVKIVVRDGHTLDDFQRAERGELLGHHFTPCSNEITGFHASVGPVEVKVEVGDITIETSDAIVTPISSSYIAKVGGSQLIQEIRNPSNQGQLRTNGYMMTGSGELLCGTIYHVKDKVSRKTCRTVLLRCLKDMDERQMKSVAISDLGSVVGREGLSEANIINGLLKAVADFSATKPQCLHHIRLLLHNEGRLAIYRTAAEMMSNFTVSDDTQYDFTVKIYIRNENTLHHEVAGQTVSAQNQNKVTQIKKDLDQLWVRFRFQNTRL